MFVVRIKTSPKRELQAARRLFKKLGKEEGVRYVVKPLADGGYTVEIAAR